MIGLEGVILMCFLYVFNTLRAGVRYLCTVKIG